VKSIRLQGGGCGPKASPQFHPNNIRDTFSVILQMAVVLTMRRSCRSSKLGRMEGQFAQPRPHDGRAAARFSYQA